MKNFSRFFLLPLIFTLFAGCASTRLPSEDIEVQTKYKDLVEILHNPDFPPNSEIKYNAARELIRKVDFFYTRETRTIDSLLCYRDAMIDRPGAVDQVFSFNYQYGDHYVRLRFFTYKMFVTRVEVTEK